LRLGSQSAYTASTGVLALILFCAGVLFATLASGWWTIRGLWRERRALARERQQIANMELIVRARGEIAAHEFTRAQSLLSGLVRRDPKNCLARIELSRTLEAAGDLKAALDVLDTARRDHPMVTEITLRAVHIQRALGNRIACLDLLDMLLISTVNSYILETARDLATELGDPKRALAYHARLVEVGYDRNRFEIERASLEFAVLRLGVSEIQGTYITPESANVQHDSTTWPQQVLQFIKRFPKCVPALIEAAKQSTVSGDPEGAAAFLTRAAQVSSDPHDWQAITQFWIDQQQPDKAVAVARTAGKPLHGLARAFSDLDLARVYMHFQMSEEAAEVLSEFEQLRVREKVSWTPELRQRFVLLQALLALQRRDAPQAQARLQKLIAVSKFDVIESQHLSDGANNLPQALSANGVSPILSTP